MWQRSKAKKDPYDSFALELLQYLCPRLSNKVSGRLASGNKQTMLQFDSAGEDAGQKLAANLVGTLMSPSQKWFRLVPRIYALRKIPAFMRWLEECADQLYAAFNNSNLNMEAAEAFLYLAYIGTSAMLQEEAATTRIGDFGGFRFRTLGFGEYCYEEDINGDVVKLYRAFDTTYSAASLVPGWIEKMGTEATNKAQNAPEEEFEVLHVVGPRLHYSRRKHGSLFMPFESCYIATKGGVLLDEGGFKEFPYAVTRWAKSPGEIYGRGPGHRAYPDVRSQNRLAELELEAGGKAVDPALLVLHEAIFGDTTLNPAGINAVDGSMVGNDVRRAVQPLESQSNFQWTVDKLERLEKKIRQSFHNDHFTVPEKGDMSATEYYGRQELAIRMLGSTFGRIYVEKLSKIVGRGFNMMYRAGAFSPPPALPREFVGSPIDVVFEGPLARAQRSHDLIAIQRKNDWLTSQMAIGNTSAKDLFDPDEEGREVAEITGLPANIVRDPDKVAQIRQQAADAARNAQVMEQLQGMLEGAGKAAPALDKLPRTASKMDQAFAGAGAVAGAGAGNVRSAA